MAKGVFAGTGYAKTSAAMGVGAGDFSIGGHPIILMGGPLLCWQKGQ
jgi:hypothetical protein